MDVPTALRDKDRILGERVELTGTIRADFHFGERPNFEEAWVMADEENLTDFSESVFLARPGLVRALFDKFTCWIGSYPIIIRSRLKVFFRKAPTTDFPLL